MIHLGLTAYEDSTKTDMIADWSSVARDVIFETDHHGFANLSAFIPMSLEEAFRIYDATPMAHVVLSDGAFTAFEGRLEDRRIVGNDRESGLEIGCYGYWRALSDVTYTACWSDTFYSDWRSYNFNATNQMYTYGNQEQLNIGLRKNEVYVTGTSEDFLAVYYGPDRPDDFILEVDFTYDISALANDWKLRLISYRRGFTNSTTEKELTEGTDASTGTVSQTLTNTSVELLVFQVNNATGSNYTVTADTGAEYAKITGLRVKGSTSTNIYADEIVDALIAHVNGINSTQLDSSTALVDSPTVEINQAVYEDMTPASIIDALAAMGDDSSPVERYEAGVWEGQKLHFRQLGSEAQDWYTDVSAIEVDSTIDDMYNSHYAVYTGDDNRVIRTTTSDDSASQSQYGVDRRRAVNASTTDDTEAGTWRDAAQQEEKDIASRASLTMLGLYTSSGALIPNYLARAHDTITIRNLPASSAAGVVDKIRTMRISRTRYDVDRDLLTIVPEELPSLEIMVAANAAAISGPNTKPRLNRPGSGPNIKP